MTTITIDSELEGIIQAKLTSLKSKVIVIGSGITSSHLGDERNLREFLIANSVSNYLREKGKNTLFLLFDDSYDPLNFRQLRVAVDKDEKLIKKFEKYCGMPLRLIPDPYDCHQNYSLHFQTEILKRFHNLGIYPNIIDCYSSYESGLYDFAKKIVFTRYSEIKKFLKKEFPKYTMKKIFWPVCSNCSKMEGTIIKGIKNEKVSFDCSDCNATSNEPWMTIKGKFSWKIDAAIKWNVFKIDFEAFSKAYLDPDVGSYFIAKTLSKKFFGGFYPEIIHYGQVLMDKSLSYKLLASLPNEVFHEMFLTHRKKDLTLSKVKIIQFARNYKIEDKLSYNKYVVSKLPYELFEPLYGGTVDSKYKKFMNQGLEFSRLFLGKEPYPLLPKKESVENIDRRKLLQIKRLIEWIILYKVEFPEEPTENFSKSLDKFFIDSKMQKNILFPIIRKLLSQEDSLPMNRIFHLVPNTFFYGCLLVIMQVLFETKNRVLSKKKIKQKPIMAGAIL